MERSLATYLSALEKPFEKQNNFNMVFASECLFAKQQIQKSDFATKTAQNNQDSLRNAILNVAAIGISLNPASAHAYLVPRKGSVCLDISYRGLVKLATDAGAITWAKAVLVYDGDEFKWRGPSEAPLHEADVFNPERMDAADPLEGLLGGYCIAELASGALMVDFLTVGEILEVKNTSKAKDGPWSGRWAGEMAKKTLIKRASKSWPQSRDRDRMDNAISILNQHEGLELSEDNSGSDYLQHSPQQLADFQEYLRGEPLDYFLWWRELDDSIKISLINSFTAAKGKGRELANAIDASGREIFIGLLADLTRYCETEDTVGAQEILGDLTGTQQTAVINAMDISLIRFANQVIRDIGS